MVAPTKDGRVPPPNEPEAQRAISGARTVGGSRMAEQITGPVEVALAEHLGTFHFLPSRRSPETPPGPPTGIPYRAGSWDGTSTPGGRCPLNRQGKT